MRYCILPKDIGDKKQNIQPGVDSSLRQSEKKLNAACDTVEKIKSPFQKRLGAVTKLRKATIRFVMSVRLSFRSHGTTRLPQNGFS